MGNIEISEPMTYYLSEEQKKWITLNLKDYSKLVKGTPEFIHVIDNKGDGIGIYFQLHIVTEKQVIEYEITRNTISSKVYDCNKDTLKVMTILNYIHKFNSPTLDDGIQKMIWFDRLGMAIVCCGRYI